MRGISSTDQGWIAAVIGALAICGVVGYGAWSIMTLNREVASLSGGLASTTVALANLQMQTQNIVAMLSNTNQVVAAVNSNVSDVRNQVGGVEQTVGSISGTVSTLQKLSTTDPELLKKYSKVYFLNENYTPAHLSTIPQGDVYSNSRPEEYVSEALPYLLNLIGAAKLNGIDLYVDSAYRSFGEQQTLKSEYVVTYGAGTANSFSADQGYSEHQLGTAVDLITTGLGGALTTKFDTTSAYQWLVNNAYKYGFELSYPKGNSYYQYEPWHWRFVGVALATYLHNNNKNFYDMDQRDIDTYLADLFS
jgi:LAS superfamily LD-carboxypeptidase LdcB